MSDSLRHRFSCVISGAFFARGIVRDRPARPSWNGLELLEPRLLLSALYWDPDGVTTDNDPDNGAHLGGNGSWTTDSNAKVWYDPASPDQDIAWPSCGGYEAVFWGTGTVTLSVSITAQGVTFKTDGYTIQSNTLTLSCGNVGGRRREDSHYQVRNRRQLWTHEEGRRRLDCLGRQHLHGLHHDKERQAGA
jgi:hypothetical protein